MTSRSETPSTQDAGSAAAGAATGPVRGTPVLPVERLRRRCDPAAFPFETTAECSPLTGLIGQHRAAAALAFGLAMPERSFNVYASGQRGTGRATAVRAFLAEAAGQHPAPSDWCYVHNFGEPGRPRALKLAPGQGRRLRESLHGLVLAARREIPRAFESEEYVAGREAIVTELNRRRQESVEQLTAHAAAVGFQLQMSPMGIGVIPMMDNHPLSEEEYRAMTPDLRAQLDHRRAGLDDDIHAFLKQMRALEREMRERLLAQDREVALHAVGGLVDDLIERYAAEQTVAMYLTDVREGILADIALFRGLPPAGDGSASPGPAPDSPERALQERSFRKYEVNVVVDNGDTGGAPVITEFNPTYPNLIGRIEREALFGALATDFTLITAGALHRANGGYLILHAEDVLRVPAAWDALKRALREGAVTIEDMGEALGMTAARGLRPDPIPLGVKVFLLGDPSLYQMLYGLDPDFSELFKVRADFDTEMDRTAENEALYAGFIHGCVAADGTHVDRSGVARLIEESSRLVEDQAKLSTRFGEIGDLVREAAHWAQTEGAPAISAGHVRRAVEQRVYRSALAAERLHEMTTRGVLAIHPQGTAIGQIHGLAVLGAGETAFGRPELITATVGVGRDGVLDIERQVALGGPIHSKGVLILGGYLTDTYARDKPLALSARLVFEQSYSGVEGDSASLAELLALLSRLAEAPLWQSLAITGSVNQRGVVQAIGGVNEKLEGFYDTCVGLGLSGEQGAIIPATNVDNLMLRDDVVEACAAGRFRVYAVRTVDEALAILTGLPAGEQQPDGSFTPDSIHARVDAGLRRLAAILRDYTVAGGGTGGR